MIESHAQPIDSQIYYSCGFHVTIQFECFSVPYVRVCIYYNMFADAQYVSAWLRWSFLVLLCEILPKNYALNDTETLHLTSCVCFLIVYIHTAYMSFEIIRRPEHDLRNLKCRVCLKETREFFAGRNSIMIRTLETSSMGLYKQTPGSRCSNHNLLTWDWMGRCFSCLIRKSL